MVREQACMQTAQVKFCTMMVVIIIAIAPALPRLL